MLKINIQKSNLKIKTETKIFYFFNVFLFFFQSLSKLCQTPEANLRQPMLLQIFVIEPDAMKGYKKKKSLIVFFEILLFKSQTQPSKQFLKL